MLRQSLRRLGLQQVCAAGGVTIDVSQRWQQGFAGNKQLQLHRWLTQGRPVTSASPAADGSVSKPAPPHRTGAGDRSTVAGFALLIPAGIAAFLGFWQLNRRQWKSELLQKREASIKGEPVDVFRLGEPPREYLRVKAQGVLQHDKAQYIGPRPRTVVGGTQVGYNVITPLYDPASHLSVLVNRGWIPAAWRDNPQDRASTEPNGEVEIEGVVRSSEARSQFVPDNDPAQGQWYWIDAPALAASADLPPDTPLVEVVSPHDAPNVQRSVVPNSMDVLAGRTTMGKVQEEYPLTKHIDTYLSFPVMPSDHLHYAATWFSLAAATTYMTTRAVRGKGFMRGRRAASSSTSSSRGGSG